MYPGWTDPAHMALTIRKDLLTHQLDGQAVLLDLASGKYLGLNETGAIVWALLLQGTEPSEVANRLARTFSVELEAAQSDVDRFIADLMQRGFIVG